LIDNQTLLESKNSLKLLWERFLTAINSVLQILIIVATPHEKQRDAPLEYSGMPR
jgi:hypothetical protein